MSLFDLFGDPHHPVADQVLKAYEYRDKWVNRLILGDSLVVMNSLTALRVPRWTGADDLHGPALRREVWLQLPALRPQTRRVAQRR